MPYYRVGTTGLSVAVAGHRHGFLGTLYKKQQLSITLKPNESDIYTFAPLEKGVAVFGCYPFYLAPGPVTEVNVEEDLMVIGSLVAAPLIVYCEKEIFDVRRNGSAVPWEFDNIRKILTIEARSHIVGIPSVYTIHFD